MSVVYKAASVLVLDIKKRDVVKRGVGSDKQQTISALLIVLNVLVLFAVLSAVAYNRSYAKNAGQATASAPFSCMEQRGYFCQAGLHCPDTLLSASDTENCCTVPCTAHPIYHRDFNYDGIGHTNLQRLLMSNT